MRQASKDSFKKVFDLTLYPDVKNFLEQQPNMTKYIVNLVRKDMQNTVSLDKEAIFAIIEEYLQLKGITPSEVKPPEDNVDNEKLKQAAMKIMGKV